MLKQKPPHDTVSKTTLSSLARYALGDSLQAMGKSLEGKLLTFLDASIADPEQRKAAKDIMRSMLLQDYYEKTWGIAQSLFEAIAPIIDGVDADCGCPPRKFGIYIDPTKLDFEYSSKPKA